MRAFLGTVLSLIAVGVLLIAYGLLAPRAAAAPFGGPATDAYAAANLYPYQTARPMLANGFIISFFWSLRLAPTLPGKLWAPGASG